MVTGPMGGKSAASGRKAGARGGARHAYRPPEGRRGMLYAVLGGLLMTGAIFLAIPLSQLLNEVVQPEALKASEAIMEAPPEIPELLASEPPPEEPEEEPPPELEEESEPLEVDLLKGLSLEVGLGGGFLDEALGGFQVDEGAMEELFDMDSLDQQPQPLAQSPPRFPPGLQKAKASGLVIVRFVIDDQGAVSGAEIEKSTDDRFNDAALAAVRQWRFRPGLKEGRPVKTSTRVPIEFRLQ